MSESALWFPASNISDVPSPSLLVYPDRIQENIHRMVKRVNGNTPRLRPHMKTHKMPEIIKMHLQHGITKFKCATIAEAEMTAKAGALEVLLAYPPVGPNVERFITLAQRFPRTEFATLVDHEFSARALSGAAQHAGLVVPVYLDVDCGMHRTGIAPDEAAVSLYELICTLPGLKAEGLHAYDGHIHELDLTERGLAVEKAFAGVEALQKRLLSRSLPAPKFIGSGTPTFGIHADRGTYECSPGTCVLWDWGYSSQYPDLNFLHAALVLTRVISKPTPNRLTVDLGHKAIASERGHPRVHFLNLPEAKAVMHSEEHLVLETSQAGQFNIGDTLYGVPWHICPTVALHSRAYIIRGDRIQGTWDVKGRDRILTV